MGPAYELPGWMTETESGVALQVQLMARGSRNRVCGLEGNQLLVSLDVASANAAANQALVKFLARELDISTAQISVVAGGAGKSKRVLLESVRAQLVSMRLSPR